jgi:hypothetical protein
VQQDDALVPNSDEKITVFERWPGNIDERGMAEAIHRKVPSKISYSETLNGQKQWGYSMDIGSTILEWTKLELMPHSPAKQLEVLRELLDGLNLLKGFQQHDELENEVPKHFIKNAVDVIQDYLYRVATEWHGHMRAEGRGTLHELDLDIVITHPIVRLPRQNR